MAKQLVREGLKYYLYELDEVGDSLKPQNYLLKFDPMKGFYLEEKGQFKMPKKIYGDTSIVNRWLKSYKHNSLKNMGILLSGTRGSGKTLLAQEFCIKSQMPVIMLEQAFAGTEFVNFLTNPVFNNSIIMIDEFEKLYENSGTYYDENGEERNSGGVNTQKDLLRLMDGNYATKLIFLLTCNESDNLSKFLTNRLSRIKYKMQFKGLPREVIDEIIKDKLKNKAHLDSINQVIMKIGMCTMDILIPLIDEMNLFGEDANECAKHLNLQSERRYYEITEIWKGKPQKCDSTSFSLSDTIVYINRDWLNTVKRTSRNDRSLDEEYPNIDIKFERDKIELISDKEVKITTVKGHVFNCVSKDRELSIIF